jgi:hypothetical protein
MRKMNDEEIEKFFFTRDNPGYLDQVTRSMINY